MKKLFCAMFSLILLLTFVSCGQGEHICPLSHTETFFDGVEFTITLDKSEYDLGDTVKATVSIVNKTDAPIELYSSTLSNYIGIGFTENGVGKLGPKTIDASTALRGTELYCGEGFVMAEEFDTNASFGTDAPVSADSEWKINSSATVIIEIDGEKKHEDISVEIVVPH